MRTGDEGAWGPDSVGLGFKSRVTLCVGENRHLFVSLFQKT